MNRRNFIKKTSLAAVILPVQNDLLPPPTTPSTPNLNYFFNSPVIIKSLELLKWKKDFFVVVTDEKGKKGITLCNARVEFLSGIFNGLVAPFFIGKDAKNIAELVEQVYKEERNYKFGGMPFWNCVGHVEVAVWDLLGKVVQKPVHQLLGKQQRSEIPMYLSSLTRDNEAEQEIDRILVALETTKCQAVKIKVGGRMKNDEKAAKRSVQIVEGLRKRADSSLTIYADGNSSLNVKEAIAMGMFLQDNGVAIFEEPCAWEDFESNRKVNNALKKIKIAGGEQDTSFFRFEWYAKNNGLDVLQPDVFYNGGIGRTLVVDELCSKYKKGFAPHSPKADPLESAFLQVAAVAKSLYGFQEYPLNAVGKKQEAWWAPHFQLSNGKLSIPTAHGLGITYDESIFKKATPF